MNFLCDAFIALETFDECERGGNAMVVASVRWLMLVPVMQVRQMGVRVRHRRMLVPVRVGLGALVAAVCVLVMLIVDVTMTVAHILVRMLVRVHLRKYEPRRGDHQRKSDAERCGKRLSEHKDRNGGANERRGAEMRGGARGAEMTQREDEQHKADAVTQEPDYERTGERRGCGKMQPGRKRQGEIE